MTAAPAGAAGGGYQPPSMAEINAPAHVISWYLTETVYHLRRARAAATMELRRWHIGQATQARGYTREVRRRHPGVAPALCRCPFPKLRAVGLSPTWRP